MNKNKRQLKLATKQVAPMDDDRASKSKTKFNILIGELNWQISI